MAFFLFLLVNATLFLRPTEVVPGLLGWKIYEALIIGCFVLALPDVLAYLTGRPLDTQPITLCVFALLPAVVLSHLSLMEGEKAYRAGFEFFKLVVYYLLLVSVVSTPARLRRFLFWTATFCTAMALLSVLRYHDLVEIAVPPPALTDERGLPLPPDKIAAKQLEARAASIREVVFDPATGAYLEIRRLRGTGIFQDPNDICLAVALAVPLCLFWLTDRRLGVLRLFWLGPLAVLCYTLYLTQSRGGLLGFLAGLGVLFGARFGWRRTLALGVAVLPVVLVVFAGRMTTLDEGGGTGQSRIRLWSDGLFLMRSAPVFGIGMDEYAPQVSQVAHNSFIHCFVELGLFGGTLFLGAFYFALLALRRSGTGRAPILDPELERLRPYLMSVLCGSAVCMLSLSLSYIAPTYTVLGLVTVYVGLGAARSAAPVLRCDLALLQRLALVSVAFLAAAYVFVRVMVRWS